MNNINKIIIEEIQKLNKPTINEDFIDNQIIGYHATPCKNIESILQNGLQIGKRNMQGNGIYSFYYLNGNDGAHAYSIRNVNYQNSCILKFKIPKYFGIIFKKSIAIEILGENNADIISQFNNAFNGWDNFMNEFVKPYKHILDKYTNENNLINTMRTLFNKDEEMAQRTLMWNIFPNNFTHKLNYTIFDGEYGVTILINNPKIIEPIGHYSINNGKLSELINFQSNKISNIINSDISFNQLLDYNINSIDDANKLKFKLNNKLYDVKNNKDYDYYSNLINLIDTLINKYNKS